MQQLLKLPLLVEHFTEHKRQNSHLSVWQFLCMHYANDNEQYADHDKDMKLPFKTHTETVNLLLFFHTVPRLSFTPHLVHVVGAQFTIPSKQSLLNAYAASIWQPPRAC